MSDAHHLSAETPGGDDGVNMAKLVAVGVVSLIIFAASAVIAWFILKADRATYEARGEAPRGALIGKEEIGIVDTVPFDADKRLEVWRAEKAQVLGSYGWADRKRGLVHIPIEEAMRLVIRDAARGGGGAPR